MGTDSGVPVRSVWRRRLLLATWLMALLVAAGRAAQVQVIEGAEWRDKAAGQHRRTDAVPARRGAILDRNGRVLAASRERVKVSVAPREVRNPDVVAGRLTDVLGLSPRRARRVVRSTDPWIDLLGFFPPSVEDELKDVRGLHFKHVMERVRPGGDLGSTLLGTVGMEGPDGGVEQALDSVLRGEPGSQIVSRDADGNVIPAPPWLVEAPTEGSDVTLTINLDLQQIARDAMHAAITETGARGGDLVAMDPRTGEVLALVSLMAGRPALTALTAPYEPGSTIKPFTVATVLERGLAELSDTIDTEGGRWTVDGRTVHDVRPRDRVTLAEALRYSSNVAVAKAAYGLSDGELYEALRGFGFGVKTGIVLSAEASGRLRRPDEWSRQSKVSLSYGYEINVTSLQMAAAYASLANGGRLLQPRLVKHIADGRTPAFEARVVRRTLTRGVARRLRSVLEQVVEEGSGVAARLSAYRLAGKSGTARAWSEGGYQPGDYFASFAGFFPADDPQVVLFVKLDRPTSGSYYGGSTAAPVLRSVIQGLLASGSDPIDRAALARSNRAQSERDVGPVRFAADRWRAMPTPAPPVPVARTRQEVRVPDVRGLPVRVAARRLHAFGFRVIWRSPGRIRGTRPPAGSAVAPGDTVEILVDPIRPGG